MLAGSTSAMARRAWRQVNQSRTSTIAGNCSKESLVVCTDFSAGSGLSVGSVLSVRSGRSMLNVKGDEDLAARRPPVADLVLVLGAAIDTGFIISHLRS